MRWVDLSDRVKPPWGKAAQGDHPRGFTEPEFSAIPQRLPHIHPIYFMWQFSAIGR